MSATVPTLPEVNYGVVRQSLPNKKSLGKWIAATFALAGLLIVAINSSPVIHELGFTFGNRNSWSYAEGAWGGFVVSAIFWVIYSGIVWAEMDDNFRSGIAYGQRQYAINVVKPWIKEHYELTVSDNDAESLYRGWYSHAYRYNEKGAHERVTISLAGSENLRNAANEEGSYYIYDEYEPLRLLVIPDPTKPPAPYEFYSVDKSLVVSN